MSKSIRHYRRSGKIENAGFHELFGIKLMAACAWVLQTISYVGYSWASHLVKTVLPSRREVISYLSDDCPFAYPYGDRYWSRLAYLGDTYAQDMEEVLKGFRDIDYAFLDCGANYGYFSVLVSSKAYGSKPAIAYEADPETYRLLARNAELCDERFETKHNAIFSKSGEVVNIFGQKHEARSIVIEDGEQQSHGKVSTICPDDMMPWLDQKGTKACLLKLDVEGVEIDALKGATRLLDRDCLVYYEDHGSDKDHEITRFVMNELGLSVFSCDDDGKCSVVSDLSQLGRIKTNPRIGYDFLATKSPLWLTEIDKRVD